MAAKSVGEVAETARKDTKHTCYLEAFVGAGAILLAKEPSKAEVMTKVSKFNPHELWDGIEDIHRRLSSVQIENLPWREAIERYDRDYTLIYADPPYLGFKNYSHSFTIKDYEELADVAKSIKGTIFISHKEHPEIRKLLRAMDVKEFPFDYSFQKGGRKKVVELVFCNREIPQ